MKYETLISKMTLEEKALLCSGKDFWNLQDIKRFGIPSIAVSDGPSGLRKEIPNSKGIGFKKSVKATCFPSAATTACSWDRDLLRQMGIALGEECIEQQVSVLLGPGVNIKRSPLCGRNFEYFSEDPFLAGEMATSFINGVQSKGVGTSIKHFAANNQETARMRVDTIADERTLREIYLAGFERAICNAKPWTVMSAYNRLNKEYCSENKWLLGNVLRGDWKFDGVVVTDWGAQNNIVDAIKAGGNLEMPSSGKVGQNRIINAVRSGDLDEKILDKCVSRILTLISKGYAGVKQKDNKCDMEQHHYLARKIARESVVLLKNDDILPLDKTKKIAVIGEMAKCPRYQGGGSSHVSPNRVDSAYESLVLEGLNVCYAPGYSIKNDLPDEALISQARSAAMDADIVLLFIGLTDKYETEGIDRKHMRLPTNHNALVDAVSAVNKNIVVVLSSGSPVEMPWIDNVKGLVHGYLGGEASGSAVSDVLIGRVNPSGKLAETYPVALENNPSYLCFADNKAVEYRESIFVGYRYYDTAKKEVRFPFGFGLSYTNFEYSDIKLSKNKINESENLTVSFKIKNIGDIDGAEIAQVYVSDEESTIFKAEKELKGFEKVFLKAGEEKEVSIELDRRAFAYYNVNVKDWHVESGIYKILVGASSRDIRLSAQVDVKSEREDVAVPDYKEIAPSYYSADVKNITDEEFYAITGKENVSSDFVIGKSYTLDSTINDTLESERGQKFYKVLVKAIKLSGKNESESVLLNYVINVPISRFITFSRGIFSEEMANGLLKILNGNERAKGVWEIASGFVKAIPSVMSFINL